MKKTAGIILLIVWFIWSSAKGLDILIRSTSTSDYYIFSTNGLTPLFFIFAISGFLLDAATVYFLFRPRPTGFYTALTSLSLSLFYSILTLLLALLDLPGVRNAYAQGREARGLPVRQETLDSIFTPSAMGIVWSAVILLIAVIAFLVVRNRRYFFQNESKIVA